MSLPSPSLTVGRAITSVPFRLMLVVAATVIAFRFSLSTMLDGFTYQSTQGDLALVPPIAAALLVLAALRHRHVGAVKLGRRSTSPWPAFFIMIAALALIVAPVTTSSYYWTLRPDMLTLPLVAAAGVALFFGARALFAFIFPLCFLLLAWPLPYSVLLENALNRLTAATVASVEAVNGIVGIAQSQGDGLFQIERNGHAFSVSVASACSGVESLIGFLIIGIAALYLVTGSIARRGLWLFCGLVAVWIANVLRILTILLVARTFGQHAAFDWLHPVLGLVVINLVAIALWCLRGRFGLGHRSPFTPAVSDTPLGRMVPVADRATPLAIGRRALLFGLIAAGLGVADGQLSGIAAAFANDGLPAVASFDSHPSAGTAWKVHDVRDITWAKTYFGSASTWRRFHLTPAQADQPPVHGLGRCHRHARPRRTRGPPGAALLQLPQRERARQHLRGARPRGGRPRLRLPGDQRRHLARAHLGVAGQLRRRARLPRADRDPRQLQPDDPGGGAQPAGRQPVGGLDPEPAGRAPVPAMIPTRR